MVSVLMPVDSDRRFPLPTRERLIADLFDEAQLEGAALRAHETAFVPERARLSYVLDLDPIHTTVAQCVFVDPVTREIYVSQAKTGTVGSRETTVVSRHTPAGVYLDSMEFEDAGHGTAIFTETDPGTGATRVWLNVIKYADGTAGSAYEHQLARVPWVAGAVYNGNSPQVTANKVNTFTALYTTAQPDFQHDLVLMRETSGSTETQYLRRFSDLLLGVDVKVSSNIITSTATDVVQGWATDKDEHFLRYLGSSTPGESGGARLQVYSWATGALVHEIDLESVRYEADGTILDDFSEPEGLSVYRDEFGALNIILGVSGGVSGKRTTRMYAITSEVTHSFSGVQALVNRGTRPWRPDGRARLLPTTGFTAFEDLNQPGWYYLTTGQFDAMADKPTDAPSGAYLLQVSARNNGGTAVVQRLFRFTTADTAARVWTRVVDFVSSAAQPWTRHIEQKPKATYTPATTNITLGTGGTIVGEYIEQGDYIEGSITVTLGTGGTLTGTPTIALPVTQDTAYLTAGATTIAEGSIVDASPSAFYALYGVPPNTSGTHMQLRTLSGAAKVTINGTTPITFAAGDKLVLNFRYRKA